MARTLKTTGLLSAFLVVSLSLTGCSDADSNTENSADELHLSDNHGASHSMEITDKQSFALAMIPHHQQAVVISEYALSNSTDPEVLAIAEQIIAEQGPEIETMTPWLEGKQVDTEMMMDGMLTKAQLTELETSQGSAFDKLYLQYVIMHHEGALVMAADAAALDDQELVDFANEIIRTQSAEIELLQELLTKY